MFKRIRARARGVRSLILSIKFGVMYKLKTVNLYNDNNSIVVNSRVNHGVSIIYVNSVVKYVVKCGIHDGMNYKRNHDGKCVGKCEVHGLWQIRILQQSA